MSDEVKDVVVLLAQLLVDLVDSCFGKHINLDLARIDMTFKGFLYHLFFSQRIKMYQVLRAGDDQ